MGDTTPQTADGKVLLHFAMSLDGFVAGPADDMGWMTGVSVRPGLHQEYIKTTGAILGGRKGWDQAIDGRRPYGGAWQGPIFVLTHHPEDAAPADGVTFLDCGPAEAARIALAAAGGKNLEVFSPAIGRQLLELGLIDEIDLHILPVLLGDGIRLYDHPGGEPVRLHRVGEDEPRSAVNVRYRPTTEGTRALIGGRRGRGCATVAWHGGGRRRPRCGSARGSSGRVRPASHRHRRPALGGAGGAVEEQEPQVRVGISGTHGTGKTTLAGALCAHLPGHVMADEPYYLLEEEGHEFGFPPSLEDYRALLARSLRSLSSPPLLPGVVFDRTPLDYLAYLAATGADPSDEASAAALRPAFAGLDLVVITLITPETERVLPAAEMPRLRARMNDALLELVYGDPLNAWEDIPVLELTGPLDGRLDAVLAALGQSR